MGSCENHHKNNSINNKTNNTQIEGDKASETSCISGHHLAPPRNTTRTVHNRTRPARRTATVVVRTPNAPAQLLQAVLEGRAVVYRPGFVAAAAAQAAAAAAAVAAAAAAVAAAEVAAGGTQGRETRLPAEGVAAPSLGTLRAARPRGAVAPGAGDHHLFRRPRRGGAQGFAWAVRKT